MTVLEQMVKTRSWKAARGLVQSGCFRVCCKINETIEHLFAECKVLANSKYSSRHDRALMIMAVTWAKEFELVVVDMVWYNFMVGTRNSVGKRKRKTCMGFRIPSLKTTMGRRLDLTLEDKAKKKIWICDMACPQQWHIEVNRLEKLTKYRQLAYKSRERHPEYEIVVVPVVIGALGGDIR